MRSEALETLFYPFEKGDLSASEEGAQGVFLNARFCPALSFFSKTSLLYQQYFKPYAVALQDSGANVSSDLPPGEGVYDFVLVLGPKNKKELRYYLASAVKLLKEGGVLVSCAPNDMGGKGLLKMFTELGLSQRGEQSKNKCRVVWGYKNGVNEAVGKWIYEGGVQTVLEGYYISQPGIYGWDKIDQGSEILTCYLPEDLKGHGADFGCGYGYLSDYVLKRCENVQDLICIDADYRAICAAQQNLSIYERNVRYLWEDLSVSLLGVRDLDWIVMNPPFHEGKKSDAGLGQNFVASAASSLCPGGQLFMVANAHLPYEDILKAQFSEVEKKTEEQGFKVFVCRK